jgi:hypothetical protein
MCVCVCEKMMRVMRMYAYDMLRGV